MLAPDGSNLPTALAALAPELRAEIRADLARLVPSFNSFEVVAVDDEFRLEVELTSGQRLTGRVLSDGTLRLLALFVLLRSARPGARIAIEEPENGVHPGSFRALVEELVEATTPRGALPPQVLLNSHSPALVAALHHRPESLVFADLVRRADGVQATRMRHVWRKGDPRDRGATTVSRRIVSDPQTLHGKVSVRDTRIPVSLVLDNLATGLSHEEILASYPSLTEEDIRACLAYAADLASERVVEFLAGTAA